MRKACLAFLCYLTIGHCFAQQDLDSFLKTNDIWPPNTVNIGGGVYMDQTEIANIHWLEFIHYLAKDSTRDRYISMLPDTTVIWPLSKSDIFIGRDGIDSTHQSDPEKMVEHYFRYPGYRYFPVVGVSYEQAEMYCKWRSEAVMLTVNDELAKNNKKFRVKYTYYLPALEEYRKASDSLMERGTLDVRVTRNINRLFPKEDPGKSYYMANVWQPLPLFKGRRVWLNQFHRFGYIFENPPNSKKIYNIYGNVSEMTSEEGKSFGGSWIHDSWKISRDAVFYYDRPQHWLGFRCACKVEILEAR